MVRGDDSTGLMQMNKAKAVKILKAPIDGYNFMQRRNVIAALNNADTSPVSVIHHRAATFGTVSYDNCHPFEHEVGKRYVVGVHNGGVPGFSRREDNIDFVVDSDWLYYRIAKLGAEKALSGINGAYALVWAEKPSDKVYIAANAERPIHWAYVIDKNIMLIASEAEMLWTMAKRSGLKIEQPLYPSKETIYEFDPFGDVRDFSTKAVEKKEIYVPPSREARMAAWDNWAERNRNQQQKTGPTGPKDYEDSYMQKDIEAAGCKDKAEVDFAFKEKGNPASGQFGYVSVIGDIMTPDAEVVGGVIANISAESAEKLKVAREIKCRVLGVRTYKTGDKKTLFICSQPHSVIVDDTTDELAEIPEDVPVTKTVKGPEGKLISEARFQELTKHGCGACSCDLALEDAPYLGWNGDSPICVDCVYGANGHVSVGGKSSFDNWAERADLH